MNEENEREETTAEALARLRARKAEMTAGKRGKKPHARQVISLKEKKSFYGRTRGKQ